MPRFDDDAMSEMSDDTYNQMNDDEVYDEDEGFWSTVHDDRPSLLDSEDLDDIEELEEYE